MYRIIKKTNINGLKEVENTSYKVQQKYLFIWWEVYFPILTNAFLNTGLLTYKKLTFSNKSNAEEAYLRYKKFKIIKYKKSTIKEVFINDFKRSVFINSKSIRTDKEYNKIYFFSTDLEEVKNEINKKSKRYITQIIAGK